MRRLGAAALVLAVASASVFAQGADPLPPEEPPAGSGAPTGSDGTIDPFAGSAAGSSGSGAVDPLANGSAATGSAGSAGAGSATGSGSASTGSATGSAGSGSAAGSNAPIVVVIPDDVAVPDVMAGVNPANVRLGEKFTLFITAHYALDVEVNLREPIELGGAFEVKRKVSRDSKAADGRKVREWQLEVYAWELGELHVPPLAVTFTSQGKAGQIATNAVPINVTGMLGDVVDDPKLVRGDAPPVSLMSRDWLWLWVVGGLLGALIVAGLSFYIWRKRKRRVRTLIGSLVMSSTTPRRLDMTSERALQRLLEIEQSGVLDRDDDRKGGYAEMVAVIREYLGGRYHVATLDLTTAELMRSLSKAAPEDERHQIVNWLERCDIVKYGGLAASAEDARGVLDGARTLVMTTTRAPGRAATPEVAA